MKKLALVVALCAFISLPATADIAVTLNPRTGNTDVANGILTLDELLTATSHTYTNVGGGGFDIKVTASQPMDHSTGELNYTKRHTSLSFEFLATGTSNPVSVSGFTVSWLDLDIAYAGTAGPFAIVDTLGTTHILNTSDTSIFTLGSALSAVDLGLGNGFTDGILSSASGNWDNNAIRFDLASTPIRSLTLVNTTDWIAPTGTMDLTVVPVPGAALLALLGLSAAATKLRKRD